jgi:hypothetical protein
LGKKAAGERKAAQLGNQAEFKDRVKRSGDALKASRYETVHLLDPDSLALAQAKALYMADCGPATSFAKHSAKNSVNVNSNAKTAPAKPPSVFAHALYDYLATVKCGGPSTVAFDWEHSGNVFFAGMTPAMQKELRENSQRYCRMDMERAALEHMAIFELTTANDSLATKTAKYKSFTCLIDPNNEQFHLNPRHGTTPVGYEQLMAEVKTALATAIDASAAAAAGAGTGDARAASAGSGDVKDAKADPAMAGVAEPQPERIPDNMGHFAVMLAPRILRSEYVAYRDDAKSRGDETSFIDPLTGNKCDSYAAFLAQRVGYVSAEDKRMILRIDRARLHAEVKAHWTWLTQYDCIFLLSLLKLTFMTDQTTVLPDRNRATRGAFGLKVSLEFHRCSPGPDRRQEIAEAKRQLDMHRQLVHDK